MKTHAAAAGLLLAVLATVPSAAQTTDPPRASVVLEPGTDAGAINPTGRAIVLTAPLMDGQAYLGDATITIGADGRVRFAAERLLALLEPRIAPHLGVWLRARLGERGGLVAADLQSVGVTLGYDPQALQLTLDVAAASRAARALDLGDGGARAPATYAAPADLSAYLNIRGQLDWVEQGSGEGLAAPVTFLDGAIRAGGIVIEGEANWQAGAVGPDFQRRGTRLVYDDRRRLMRFAAGDLLTLARGFQAAPQIAGLSMSRFYSLLDPQTVIRPRGSRSFQLERRSTVEVRVNNQLVRRMELDPGTFDLKDFPFAQGSNDVRLTITDDAGRTQSIDFDIFLDQAQLAAGLSEFGLYAGVLAPNGVRGPRYSNDLAFSGFYRRGVSDWLTLGANAQAEERGWMAGAETVVATPIGSFAGFASASHVAGIGSGWASILTFQRTIARGGERADALSLSFEARSRDFAPIDSGIPSNPYLYIAGLSYNATLSDTIYGGVDARFSRGRDGEADVGSARVTGGWRINPLLSFSGDLTYERTGRGSRFGAFLSLTLRLDRASNLRADYDSRYNRSRLSYQTYHGSGTGAYNFNADVERSDIGAGATLNGVYYANRAELGFSHFGTFERNLGGSTAQRTALRLGTAIAMADGTVSLGRPIQDGFAIVRAHRSLEGADLLVDPNGSFAVANTGVLGTAVHSSLSSYSERGILVTAPDAPLGANLGEGSFRLLPPYRGGYRLTVGSDYTISVVGRLLDAKGAPVALVAGSATEEARPEREPVALFTNAAGRFGVAGLAPGRWRITLADSDETSYELAIAKDAKANATVAVGDLRPGAR